MKARELNELALQLKLPGFEIHKRLLFVRPVEHVLRGFFFEDSGFDPSSFYVWAFFMVLCVPTKHINFNLGKRLRDSGSEGWYLTDPGLAPKLIESINREGLPFVARAASIQSATEIALSSQIASRPNICIQETISYGLVRCGQFDRAREEINKLKQILDPGIAWQHEIAERAQNVETKLESNPEEAQLLLSDWENQTASDLGIKRP